MHPAISGLIRHTYPALEDHPSTASHPPARGLPAGARALFLDHRAEEDGGGGDSGRRARRGWSARAEAAGQSKSNASEAALAVACVKYLLRQGYAPGQLVVLTPYLVGRAVEQGPRAAPAPAVCGPRAAVPREQRATGGAAAERRHWRLLQRRYGVLILMAPPPWNPRPRPQGQLMELHRAMTAARLDAALDARDLRELRAAAGGEAAGIGPAAAAPAAAGAAGGGGDGGIVIRTATIDNYQAGGGLAWTAGKAAGKGPGSVQGGSQRRADAGGAALSARILVRSRAGLRPA
jgi:hypothetical protein